MPIVESLPPPIAPHAPPIAELCAQNKVGRLELFGSGTTANYDPSRSDLDFLVTFLPTDHRSRQFFGLLFGLEDLLKRNIDLLTVEQLTNPFLIEAINSQKITIYAVK